MEYFLRANWLEEQFWESFIHSLTEEKGISFIFWPNCGLQDPELVTPISHILSVVALLHVSSASYLDCN